MAIEVSRRDFLGGLAVTFASAFARRLSAGDKDAAWRRIGEGAFPGETFTKTIKGFSFVGTHWKHEDETVRWLKTHPEVDTSKLFVYV